MSGWALGSARATSARNGCGRRRSGRSPCGRSALVPRGVPAGSRWCAADIAMAEEPPDADNGPIAMAVANALEVKDLQVAFGNTAVLRDLTFTVPQGSSLAIIGPNGSGKTVLFQALVGSVPYRGQIRWAT